MTLNYPYRTWWERDAIFSTHVRLNKSRKNSFYFIRSHAPQTKIHALSLVRLVRPKRYKTRNPILSFMTLIDWPSCSQNKNTSENIKFRCWKIRLRFNKPAWNARMWSVPRHWMENCVWDELALCGFIFRSSGR